MSADGARGTEMPVEHTPGHREGTLPALSGFLPPWIFLCRWEVFFFLPLLDADAFWIRTNTTAEVTQAPLLEGDRT